MEQTGLMLPPDLIDTLGEPSTSSFDAAQLRDALTASTVPPTTAPTQAQVVSE